MKIYAVIGTNRQAVVSDGVRYTPVEGEILMQSERPTDGEYVAKADGTWGLYEPTKEENLAQLVAQYEADKAEILKYYADAMIHGDTELMAELSGEMTALDEKYATDYKALKGEE